MIIPPASARPRFIEYNNPKQELGTRNFEGPASISSLIRGGDWASVQVFLNVPVPTP